MSTGKYSLGNQKSGGSFTKRKNFYIDEGSNIFRVLPPFGSLAAEGKIAKYWAITWVSASKGKRPVVCLENKLRDGTIKQADPLRDKVAILTAQYKALEASGTASDEVLKQLNSVIWGLNLDKSYYLNVMSPANEIGVLKIKGTSFKALMERLTELEKMGVDPINGGMTNGIFFDFKRVKGADNKVAYTVDFHYRMSKDPATGRVVSEMVQAPIDEATLEDRMKKEASDLSKLFTPKTLEEVAQIATLDPKNIDRVFQSGQVADVAVADDDSDDDGSLEDQMKVTATLGTAGVANTKVAAAKTAAPTPPALDVAEKIDATPTKAATANAANGADTEDQVRKFLFGG